MFSFSFLFWLKISVFSDTQLSQLFLHCQHWTKRCHPIFLPFPVMTLLILILSPWWQHQVGMLSMAQQFVWTFRVLLTALLWLFLPPFISMDWRLICSTYAVGRYCIFHWGGAVCEQHCCVLTGVGHRKLHLWPLDTLVDDFFLWCGASLVQSSW